MTCNATISLVTFVFLSPISESKPSSEMAVAGSLTQRFSSLLRWSQPVLSHAAASSRSPDGPVKFPIFVGFPSYSFILFFVIFFVNFGMIVSLFGVYMGVWFDWSCRFCCGGKNWAYKCVLGFGIGWFWFFDWNSEWNVVAWRLWLSFFSFLWHLFFIRWIIWFFFRDWWLAVNLWC